MSRAQEPQRTSFPFGNPFRTMLQKGSSMPRELLVSLNTFEQALAGRLRKLLLEENSSICSLSWMTLAVKLLSETHSDIKSLIHDLELPVSNWDESWIDVYLGDTVELLDVCIAFSSEISRLGQGQLLVQSLLHNLSGFGSPKEYNKARSSLDSWSRHVASKNTRIENCCAVVDQLVQSLGLPKMKNSAKGRVLMQAMYGVRALTILVCSAFILVFKGSNMMVVDLDVPKTHAWADAYSNLQSSVNEEVSQFKSGNAVIKELGEVDRSGKKLLSSIQENFEAAESKAIKDSISELEGRTESLSGGLDELAKEVEAFFQIVFGGRDALLCNLRSTMVSKEDHHKRGANKVACSHYLLNSKYKV